jgi:hypothetical protein
VGDSFRLNSFFENYYISIPNFRASFFISEDYVLFLTKNGLGNSLGDFFINSSGHPGVDILITILDHFWVKKIGVFLKNKCYDQIFA